MKYNSVLNGKVLNWSWKNRKIDYLFFVGDRYIGQLWYIKKLGWTCLHREPNFIGLAHGFKTKLAASEFLLKFEPELRDVR